MKTNNKKSIGFILFLLLIFIVIILIQSKGIEALGITPAKVDQELITFETFTNTFSIINNENKDMTVFVSVRGELKDYIQLETTTIQFSKEEEKKTISYTVNIPSNLLNPGLHTAEIVVVETSSNINHKDESVIISVNPSMVYRVNLRLPFPGKYLESGLVISETQVNHDVRFVLPLFNYGKEKINNIKADIKVFGPTNELITQFTTNEISLEPHEQSNIFSTWYAAVPPGFYHTIATIDYDGTTLILEQDFTLGSLFIDVYRLDIPDFTLGNIAKFDIYLDNQWNQPVENIYGEMTITDKEGTLFSQFKTASIDMQPLAKDKLVAYWDTKEVNIGDYNIRLLVHYADIFTEKLIKATVNLDSIYTDLTPTGQVIGTKLSQNKNSTLTFLVLILLFINIGWFWYFIKNKKRKNKDKEGEKNNQEKPLNQSSSKFPSSKPASEPAAKLKVVEKNQETMPKVEIVDLPEKEDNKNEKHD